MNNQNEAYAESLAKLIRIEEDEKTARRNAGRYNLVEAIAYVRDKTGEIEESIRLKLIEAADSKNLISFGPKSSIPYKGDRIGTSRENIFDTERFDLNEFRQADLDEWMKTLTPLTLKNKLRTHDLDSAIEKAIKQANSLKLADVYNCLKELALANEIPFTGNIEGDALCYTDHNDQLAKLSRDALRSRLKRRKP